MRNVGLVKTLTAGAAINAYRFCQFNGSTELSVIQSAGVTSLPLGVSDLGADASGDRVDIILTGIATVMYGDTITQGQELTSDANGKAVPAADSIVRAVIDGGAAGNLTVTGIKTTDTLVGVLRLDVEADTGTSATGNKIQAISDLTSEFTITATNTINNAAGTNTTGDRLMVMYRRKDKVYGRAMISGVSGDLGSVLL